MTQNREHPTTRNGTAALHTTRDAVRDDDERPGAAQQAWRDAVALVTLRAKDHYGAELHGRLDKAQTLVLGGHVTLGDGVATVVSETDSALHYRVKSSCDCPDAEDKAPQGYCKHRLAVMIHKRAVQEAAALLERRRADPPAGVAPGWSSEATVSMNTHLTIDGRQMQVTVRTGATRDDCHRVMVVMQEVLAEHPEAPPSWRERARRAPPAV